MDKPSYLSDKINGYTNSFNFILAHKDMETFKKIQNLNNKFNFINLSSDFAVNFILEYEKIDLIIKPNYRPDEKIGDHTIKEDEKYDLKCEKKLINKVVNKNSLSKEVKIN